MKVNYLYGVILLLTILISSCQEEPIVEDQIENPFDLPLNEYVEYLVNEGETDIASKVAIYMDVNNFTSDITPLTERLGLHPPAPSTGCYLDSSFGTDNDHYYRIWEIKGSCSEAGCTHIWTYTKIPLSPTPILMDYYCH